MTQQQTRRTATSTRVDDSTTEAPAPAKRDTTDIDELIQEIDDALEANDRELAAKKRFREKLRSINFGRRSQPCPCCLGCE